MAEERLKALVARLGAIPDVHVAAWSGAAGSAGEAWLEDDGRGVWPVRILRTPEQGGEDPQATLVQPASQDDLAKFAEVQRHAEELRRRAQQEAEELGLRMRFIAAELDMKRRLLRLPFAAPERVDFRELLRKLSGPLQMRVELRQVGPRDEARILGGIGPCGQEVCCRRFLRQLRPIPLEMAFDQQLFFSPGRITGVCGRLVCCLSYEHQQYLEALAGVPKVGQRIAHGDKVGKVIGLSVFRRTLTVHWADGSRGDVPWDALEKKGDG